MPENKELTAAYAAGLMDGEGSIGFLRRQSQAGRLAIQPMVQCATTDDFIAPFFKQHWGGQLFVCPRARLNPKWKDALCWNLTGFDNILRFLRDVSSRQGKSGGRGHSVL